MVSYVSREKQDQRKDAPQIAACNKGRDEAHCALDIVCCAARRSGPVGRRVGEVEERLGQVGREAFAEALAHDKGLCVEKRRTRVSAWAVTSADRGNASRTHAAIARTARLCACDAVEEAPQLVVQERDVAAAEDLSDKGATRAEDVQRDVQGLRGDELTGTRLSTFESTHSKEQLRLDKLVQVVQARHVGCAVADDKIG